MHRTRKGRILGGCKLPSEHALLHAPRLERFMAKGAAIPTTPNLIDWSAPAIQVIEDIEGNADYGDCVEAEDAHYIAVITGNSNTLYAYTDAQTLADYAAMTGFNPSDPNTDQGTDPIAALNYRVAKGYADGSKDAGWALVDATNRPLIQYALATFGNLKMWFGIPDGIVQNEPNESGFVWDVSAGAPDQNNGHCIGSCGYNPTKILVVGITAQGLLVMTWGMLGIITWAAVAAWFAPSVGGGLAVRVSQDWINKQSGKSPAGLDLPGMIQGFNTYFGGNIPVPAPPVPPPTPGAPVTLTQAKAWVAQGIGTGYPLDTREQAITLAQGGLEANWTGPQ